MKLFLSMCIILLFGLNADAKADYWRSPNPSRILLVGEIVNLGEIDNEGVELFRLLRTAFHSVHILRRDPDTQSFDTSGLDEHYPVVIADKDSLEAASVYLADPDSGVIVMEGSSLRMLDAVELRLAAQAGNLALVKQRLDSLAAIGVKRTVDLFLGRKTKGGQKSLIMAPPRSGKKRFLLVGDLDHKDTSLSRVSRMHELVPVSDLDMKPSESFVLVIADPNHFDSAMTKFGATFPVMQVESNDHELRTLYQAEILLAEWAGDSTKAEKLKAQQDGFDFEKLSTYEKWSKDSPAGRPSPVSSSSSSTEENLTASPRGNSSVAWRSSLLFSFLGWFFMYFTLRRFPVSSRPGNTLDAWSIPQLVAVGALIGAAFLTPGLGLLSGAAVAVTWSIRRRSVVQTEEAAGAAGE